MKKILLLMTIVLLATVSSYSQAPGIFNYQGVARNSVGNVLANKSISLRLTIHDNTAAGPTVYQESRAVVTNPFGLFNVQVGSPGATNVTGNIPGVSWGVGAKYIQVEIDPNGGSAFINIGTAQLASVPYALLANSAMDLVLPFNKTQADAGTLFKITNSGTGSGSTSLEGVTNSTAGNVAAVKGIVSSTGPGGFSTGILGQNNGTSGLGIGVTGTQNGSGWGVYGNTPSGLGVFGNTTSGIGVQGSSSSGTGVQGSSTTGVAGIFSNTNNANTSDALQASTNGTATSWALRATSTGAQGAGIFVYNNAAGTANAVRVTNNGSGAGVSALTTGTGSAGVFANTNAANTTATLVVNNDGTGGSINGVQSTITSTSPGGFSTALRGVNNGTGGLGIGVYGSQAGSGWGVLGIAPGGLGVYGSTTTGTGVFADAGSGTAMAATSNTGLTANFQKTNAANTNFTVSVTDADVTTAGFFNGGIMSVKGTTAGVVVLTGTSAIKGVSSPANGIGVNGGSNAGFGVAGVTQTGIGVVAFANNVAGFGLVTVGRVQIQGQGAALNRVLTSDAVGNATWQALGAIGGVTGSGTVNFVSKWTPIGTNLGNSQIFDDASRVNVGTNFGDPNSVTINNTAPSGGNASLMLEGAAGFGNAHGIYLENATNRLHFTANSYDADAGTKIMTLDGNQLNVGIGTATPGGLLLSEHATGGSFALTKYTNTGTGQATFSDGFVIGQDNSAAVGNVIIDNLENTDIISFTNATPRTWLKNTGQFGIGTPAPVGPLHVEGVGAATTIVPTWINYAPNSYFNNRGASATNKVGGLGFADGSTSGWNEGLTGIAGGSAPFGNIGVTGLSGEVGTAANYGFYAQVGNSPAANIGVFSLAPLGPNDWAGYFSGRVRIVDGTEGVGKIFTDNGSGNGTGMWSSPSGAGLVSGSGTLNFIPKWTPDGVTLGNSRWSDDGTYMRLDGGGGISSLNLNTNAGVGNTSINMLTGSQFFQTQVNANGQYAFVPNSSIPTDPSSVVIDDDGEQGIGIGTTTPTAKLHTFSNSTITTPHIMMEENDNDFARVNFKTTDAVNSGNNFWAIAGYNHDTRATERLNFYNNANGNLMSITGDGLVGVGTTTPSTIRMHVNEGLGNFAGVRMTNATTGQGSGDGFAIGIPFLLGNAPTILNFENSDLTLGTNGVTRVTIKNTGELDFVSALRPLGNAGNAGDVLTSNGAGVAPSWQGNIGISIKTLAGIVVIPDGVFTPITQWSVIQYEDGGANYSAGTGEYTITANGVYTVNAALLWDPFGANDNFTAIRLHVNGVFEYEEFTNSGTGRYFTTGLSYTKRFVAGDKISIVARQNSGANQTITGPFSGNAFSVTLNHR